METSWILQSILTAFMCFFIPVYTIKYGWRNFLWFSDLMFILTYLGIMTSSLLLVSMAAVGGMLFELTWAILFFLQLFFGFRISLSGFVNYMFDPKIPLWLRLVSLFHLFMPIFWIWALTTYGYDSRAWFYGILFLWSALAVTWLVTDTSANINWVFEYKVNPKLKMSAISYLAIGFVFVAVLVTLTHFLFERIFS